MSLTYFQQIFPSLWDTLPKSVIYNVFPASTLENCPTPVIIFNDLEIRWPNLLLFCAIGALVGFGGGRSLRARKPGYAQSFMYFGVMNVTALLTHSFFQPRTFLWNLTYAFDMVATSTSSMHLTLAVLEVKLPGLFIDYYFFHAFSLQWLEIKLNPRGGWWIAEALYIGVTSLAAAVAFQGLVVRTVLNEGLLSRRCMCLWAVLVGVLMFVAGPVADASMCTAFGNPWGNLMSAGEKKEEQGNDCSLRPGHLRPHLDSFRSSYNLQFLALQYAPHPSWARFACTLIEAFLGCDVAFLGIYCFLQLEPLKAKGKAKRQ